MKALVLSFLLFLSVTVTPKSRQLGRPMLGRQPREWDLNPDGELPNDTFTCQFCKVSMFAFTKTINMQLTQKLIRDYAVVQVCTILIKDKATCEKLYNQYGKGVIDAITASILDPEYFCEEMAPACNDSGFTLYSPMEGAMKILETKPYSIRKNDHLNNLYKDIRKNLTLKDAVPRKTVKAVHFSDSHVDKLYTIGTSNECAGPQSCCRSEYGFPTNTTKKAMQWGHYTCDTPLPTFQSFLDFVKLTVKPDVIFWTGDNAPHNSLNTNEQDVLTSTTQLTQIIKGTFAKTGIRVYPIQGALDIFPADFQDYSHPNTIKGFGTLADYWVDFIGNDAAATYRKFGYYSTEFVIEDFRRLTRRTKLIGINTLTCSVTNFGILKARFDPADQLGWLERELTQLELDGWQAIIMGHMPPFLDCAQAWGIRYRALIERFQHIVRTNLFGYSHRSEISIVQALYSDNTDNINLMINTGSLSPFGGKNPTFSVIEFDAEYMIPTSLETYWLNLTQANQKNTPDWKLLSNFTKEYNLTDMSPDSVMNFAKTLRNNETASQTYLWNQDRRYEPAPPATCDADCRYSLFCEITSTDYFGTQTCKGYQEIDFIHDPYHAMINLLTSSWVVDSYRG